MVLDDEKRALRDSVFALYGAPIRKIEIEDEQFCNLLSLSVADYAERVQNFIIENNWANFYGKDLNNIDLAYAWSVRTLDLARDYSYYFSKEVGLQQRGPWELKKDFFEIELGKQVYVIPSGREINKVLWVTPPTTDAALFANYGGLGVSFGGGVMAQTGLGTASLFGGMSSAYGMGAGLWALPAADIAYMSADLAYKNEIIRCDLVYKVTAGPDGTHLIHLLSTPGSKLTFGMGGIGQYSLQNCAVWYTYYDTNGNDDECRKDNTDVILSPDQIPLNKVDYELLNEPAKAVVRQILIGKVGIALSFIRGKFSGAINMIGSQLTMDYNMLMTYGQNVIDKAIENLDKRLERMSPYYLMEKQAKLVQDLKEAKKGTPLGIYVI